MSNLRLLLRQAQAAPSPRALLADQRGATMLTFGMLAPLAFAAVGLGIDASMWYAQGQRLQATADLAALAGARQLALGSSEAAVTTAAANAAAQNGFTIDAEHTLDVALEARENGTSLVQVVATGRGDRYFSGLVLGDDPVIRRTAQAEFVPPDSGAVCVLGLDPQRQATVEFQGTAVADLNCGVMSNSVHVASLEVAGTGYLSATRIEAFGGISQGANATVIGPQRAGAWPIQDPYSAAYRNLQTPAASTCTATGKMVVNKSNAVLTPGRYCNGIRITNSNVTFQPGVYILDEGDLEVAGTSSLTGHGVVFILTGSDANKIGQVKIPGGTTLDLVAPDADAAGAAAEYHGVLFYQDARAPSFQGASLRANSVLGGSGDRIEGALYFPSQEVFFTGGMTSSDSCLQIVARKVTMTGNAAVRHGESACADLGVTPIIRTGVKLVS
jgi:Flp pilus assembly protein TadG